MTEEINKKLYRCPTCNKEYFEEEKADECLKRHSFPKRVKVSLMTLHTPNIDKCLSNIAKNIGLKDDNWNEGGNPIELFGDSFHLDFFAIVEDSGIAKIESMKSLALFKEYEVEIKE